MRSANVVMAVILRQSGSCHEWQKRQSALIFCQTRRKMGAMRKVAVIVQDGAEPFGLGAMCEVWAEPYHPEDDNPVFDFKVCTPRPGRVSGVHR